MTAFPRRVAVLAAAVVALAGLSGCSAFIPSAPTTTPTSAPTPSTSSDAFVPLTFDDGARLDPSTTTVWADTLATAAGFSAGDPHEDGGSWSYVEDATDCEIGFWQGTLDGVDAGSGDSDASDGLLAVQFETTADEVAGFVEDGAGPFTTPGELVETRAVLGTSDDDDSTYIVAARAFTVLDVGMMATMQCPAGVETTAEWARLAADPAAFLMIFQVK